MSLPRSERGGAGLRPATGEGEAGASVPGGARASRAEGSAAVVRGRAQGQAEEPAPERARRSRAPPGDGRRRSRSIGARGARASRAEGSAKRVSPRPDRPVAGGRDACFTRRMADAATGSGQGQGQERTPPVVRAARWVLYGLLLVTVALTLFGLPELQQEVAAGRWPTAALALPPALLALFIVGYAAYRIALVRAGRYGAGKTLVQVAVMFLVLAIVAGVALRPGEGTRPGQGTVALSRPRLDQSGDPRPRRRGGALPAGRAGARRRRAPRRAPRRSHPRGPSPGARRPGRPGRRRCRRRGPRRRDALAGVGAGRRAVAVEGHPDPPQHPRSPGPWGGLRCPPRP